MTLLKRMIGAAAVLAVGATGLAACSNSESTKPAESSTPADLSDVKGEITFMTQGLQKDFKPFFDKQIADFEKANPGTKIKWVDESGGPEFDQKMTQQATSGTMADVINVPSSTILALTKTKNLMNLDEKLPDAGERYIPSIWKSVGMGEDGAHTALPWYFSPFVTTYNKSVFERNGLDVNNPPKTMDELFAAGHKIAAAGKGDYAVYGNANWTLINQWIGMGVKVMNDDQSEFTFAGDPNALKWVTEMASLYKEGAISKDSLTGEPDPGKEYLNGHLAFGTPNPGFIRNIKKNNEQIYANTGVSQYQREADAKPVFNGQFIAVSSKTKNEALALKFADYVTSVEQQLAWTRDGGAVIFPPATEALDQLLANPPEAVASDPTFKATYEVAAKDAKEAVAYPATFFVTGNVQKSLVDNVNAAIRGEVEPKAALEKAQQEMNQLLAKLNSK